MKSEVDSLGSKLLDNLYKTIFKEAESFCNTLDYWLARYTEIITIILLNHIAEQDANVSINKLKVIISKSAVLSTVNSEYCFI